MIYLLCLSDKFWNSFVDLQATFVQPACIDKLVICFNFQRVNRGRSPTLAMKFMLLDSLQLYIELAKLLLLLVQLCEKVKVLHQTQVMSKLVVCFVTGITCSVVHESYYIISTRKVKNHLLALKKLRCDYGDCCRDYCVVNSMESQQNWSWSIP
jgi:hypothetical protein